MSCYELGIIGDPSVIERTALRATLARMFGEFGLEEGTGFIIHDGTSVNGRNNHSAFAAVYFGTSNQYDKETALKLVKSSAPIIPTVEALDDFSTNVPDFLQFSNGLRRRRDDPELIDLATALLECVGLLRKQRRVFISYRRTESRAAAVQLHDLLIERGFDVFLDTHDIRPGDAFQDVLWNRLCDSDVMLMLDTPTYFESKWTSAEVGRALAKEIHVLLASSHSK